MHHFLIVFPDVCPVLTYLLAERTPSDVVRQQMSSLRQMASPAASRLDHSPGPHRWPKSQVRHWARGPHLPHPVPPYSLDVCAGGCHQVAKGGLYGSSANREGSCNTSGVSSAAAATLVGHCVAATA